MEFDVTITVTRGEESETLDLQMVDADSVEELCAKIYYLLME